MVAIIPQQSSLKLDERVASLPRSLGLKRTSVAPIDKSYQLITTTMAPTTYIVASQLS
jgi:hypothetical protein